MLEFHDPIPDLAGRTCADLLVEEYAHRGDAVTPVAVVLHTDDQKWHRFFIDAGVVFWRVSSAPPSLPSSDAQYHYSVRDVGEAEGLRGREITGIRTFDLPGGGAIRVDLSGGPSVMLRDVDDASELRVESHATPFA